MPVLSHQEVGRFDVPVDDFLVVYWMQRTPMEEKGQENPMRISTWSL